MLSPSSSSFHLQSSQTFFAIIVLIIFIIVAVVQLTIHNATINSQMPAVYAERPVSLQRKHAGTLIDWCVGQYSWNGCWFSCIIRSLIVECIPTPSSLYLSPLNNDVQQSDPSTPDQYAAPPPPIKTYGIPIDLNSYISFNLMVPSAITYRRKYLPLFSNFPHHAL